MDQEVATLNDWAEIENYLTSSIWIRLYGMLSNIPLIRSFFKQQLYNEICFVFDVVQNFDDGHKIAIGLLENLIKNQDFLGRIKSQSERQVKEAQSYKQERFSMYPEIRKAVAQRRAMYLILNHQQQMLNELVDCGQMEHTECELMMHAVNQKLSVLKSTYPRIQFENASERLAKVSILSEIFSTVTLDEATSDKCAEVPCSVGKVFLRENEPV